MDQSMKAHFVHATLFLQGHSSEVTLHEHAVLLATSLGLEWKDSILLIHSVNGIGGALEWIPKQHNALECAMQ